MAKSLEEFRKEILTGYYQTLYEVAFEFNKLIKDAATELHKGKSPREEKIVERLTENLKDFSQPFGRYNLKIESEFIHGTRSRVRLSNGVVVEAGDAIFVAELNLKKKVFYRTFITQFKNLTEDTAWKPHKAGDSNQLYLLSKFPPFEGVMGLFNLKDKKEWFFSNLSDTLGMYSFIIKRQDTFWISAKLLEYILNQYGQFDIKRFPIYFPFYFDCLKFSTFLWLHYINPFSLVSTCLAAPSSVDFFIQYALLFIGEPLLLLKPVGGSTVKERTVNLLKELDPPLGGGRGEDYGSREEYPEGDEEGFGIFWLRWELTEEGLSAA